MSFKRSLFVLPPVLVLSAMAFFVGANSNAPKSEKKVVKASIVPPAAPATNSMEVQFEEIMLKRGVTLSSLLKNNDVASAQAYGIIEAMRKVFSPKKIRAGERIKLARDDYGSVREVQYKPSASTTVIVRRDYLDNFTASVDTLPGMIDTGLIFGEIETSLYAAVLKTGESPELISKFSDIFQWDVDFLMDPRVGDRFAILFEKEFVSDGQGGKRTFVGYGDILAGAYIKRDTTLTAYGFPNKQGFMRYYDEQGRSFQKTFLKSPLNYSRISSYFSYGRFHPILKRVRAHTGVDFSAPRGTPVVASADGKVISAGWNGGYGNCIKISHKNGTYVTLYGHLSRFARGLRAGAQVSQNQVIGYVGSTGLSTGPHLHYTMYQNGKPINPLRMKSSSGDPIAKSEMLRFTSARDVLLFRLGLNLDKEPIFDFEASLAQAR